MNKQKITLESTVVQTKEVIAGNVDGEIVMMDKKVNIMR